MSTDHAFQPEAVEALAAAFEKAWRFISQDRHFAGIDRPLLQQRLAACLIELSADGDHDSLWLANHTVVRMREECGRKLRVG